MVKRKLYGSGRPDLLHLAKTIAELYQEKTTNIRSLEGYENLLNETGIRQFHVGHPVVRKTCLPRMVNPFESSIVFYSVSASRLMILLLLEKTQWVVVEIFDQEGQFLKRLFSKNIHKGVTEIIVIGCQHLDLPFVLVLNSGEGMRSFIINSER